MPYKPCNAITDQSGAALISIVGLLLGLVTFALWMTSSTLLDEYRVQRNTIAFERAMNQLQNEMTALTAQLHKSNNSLNPPLNKAINSSVVSNHYQGNNHQPITVFTITLEHTAPEITIQQQYVRYPALLQLPSKAKIPSGTPDTLVKLFNRTASTLLPNNFSAPSINANCNNRISAVVIWINGHCNIKQGTIMSNPQVPVLIIVQNGDLVLEDGVILYGLVIILANRTPHFIPTVTIMPSAQLHGGVTSNTPVNSILQGRLEFNLDTLKTLQNLSELQKIHPIPGSWHDFN